jgi:hypothetical protein
MSRQVLTVYISDHCPSCIDAKDIARRVREQYPAVEVETFNVDRGRPRSEVFAVPTYMLDDRIVFLGNPTDEQIDQLLTDAGREWGPDAGRSNGTNGAA